MDLGLQRANGWKRISAFLLDAMLLVMLAVGVGSLISALIGYDGLSTQLTDIYARYEKEYDTSFDYSEEDYGNLSEEARARYDAAYQALIQDTEAITLYRKVVAMSFLLVCLSLLAAFLVLEFAVPLLLKQGRTLGKRVFGLAVMREDMVAVSGPVLFIRTVLGKYSLETMIPVAVFLMLYFNMIGLLGGVLLLSLLVMQIVVFATSHTGALLHDKLAGTVVVDMATQRIFDTKEEMLDAKKEAAAEQAKRAEW